MKSPHPAHLEVISIQGPHQPLTSTERAQTKTNPNHLTETQLTSEVVSTDQVSAWVTRVNQDGSSLFAARPHQGVEVWEVPQDREPDVGQRETQSALEESSAEETLQERHQRDASAKLTFREVRKLTTGSLSARDLYRPFSLTPKGELITLAPRGVLIGDGTRWRHAIAPPRSGALLGATYCDDKLLWITSRRVSTQVTADQTPKISVEESSQASQDQASQDQASQDQASQDQASQDQASQDQASQDQASQDQASQDPKYPLSVEVWSDSTQAKLMSFDWSDQRFRAGRPSLGEVICSDQTIYANLFWGTGAPRRVGVGLLIIEPLRKRSSIWERRLGYDGERALSETPLLPTAVFNSIRPAQRGSLYLSTDSGLALARPQESAMRDQLLIFDEAYGWYNELFNDVIYETDETGDHAPQSPEVEREVGGRVWLATPRGLEVIRSEELKTASPRLRIKGAVSALGLGGEHELWVAFKQKLWVGRGDQKKEWSNISLKALRAQHELGVIHSLLVRPQGGLWMITSSGVFFNAELGSSRELSR